MIAQKISDLHYVEAAPVRSDLAVGKTEDSPVPRKSKSETKPQGWKVRAITLVRASSYAFPVSRGVPPEAEGYDPGTKGGSPMRR